MDDSQITGTMIQYYFICKRKLWFFLKDCLFENFSELVKIGSVIHETSYSRKRKEILLGSIKLDFYEKNKKLVYEVKKSNVVEDAHIWQLKYYLYCLKLLGLNVRGKLVYPKMRKTKEIELSSSDVEKLELIIEKINRLRNSLEAPKIESKSLKFCKNCSYYEFCYI